MNEIKEMQERIYRVKEAIDFEEVVECCQACLCSDPLGQTGEYWCNKHRFAVFHFSKCKDYED